MILNGIDLFSGAGGMTLGASMAGIKTVLAIELDSNSAETFRYNFPKIKVIVDDINKIEPTDYSYLKPYIVYGGPPCQGFSISNTRNRKEINPKNKLYKEFVKFVKYLNPHWFVFENVEGIISLQNGLFIKNIVKDFESLGYFTKYSILCASDYGVPQNRNRFFLIGNNKNINFEFPVPTHYNNKITVSEAIYDLPSLANGDKFLELNYKTNKLKPYTKLMRNGSKIAKQNFVTKNKDYVLERYTYIKPGENWKAIPESLMENYKNKKNCHSGIYKKASF